MEGERCLRERGGACMSLDFMCVGKRNTVVAEKIANIGDRCACSIMRIQWPYQSESFVVLILCNHDHWLLKLTHYLEWFLSDLVTMYSNHHSAPTAVMTSPHHPLVQQQLSPPPRPIKTSSSPTNFTTASSSNLYNLDTATMGVGGTTTGHPPPPLTAPPSYGAMVPEYGAALDLHDVHNNNSTSSR